jgi:hypothetical protein
LCQKRSFLEDILGTSFTLHIIVGFDVFRPFEVGSDEFFDTHDDWIPVVEIEREKEKEENRFGALKKWKEWMI